MKYLFLIISSTLLFHSYGQQDPLFSSEGFTPLRINPASFGSWNKFSVNTAGRLQWTDLEGAPKSLLVNAEYAGYIGKSKKENTYNFGVGLDLLIEEIGYQQIQQLKVPLAYSLTLGKTKLAIGIAPGFNRNSFTPDWILPDTTSNDPALPTSSQTIFDIDGGINWYGEKFYLGISATHLTAPNMGDINYKVSRHYHLNSAYRFDINGYTIMPILNVSGGSGFWLIENMNYFMFKKDIVSLGIGFRRSSALMAAAAFQWKGFRVAYNFDYSISPLSAYSAHSHEVRLSYIIKKKN